MPIGTVKFFNRKNGFGYIATGGHVDVYISADAVAESGLTLKPGDRISFDVVTLQNGKSRAANLARVEGPVSAPLNADSERQPINNENRPPRFGDFLRA